MLVGEGFALVKVLKSLMMRTVDCKWNDFTLHASLSPTVVTSVAIKIKGFRHVTSVSCEQSQWVSVIGSVLFMDLQMCV